jgi:hypothetical protein
MLSSIQPREAERSAFFWEEVIDLYQGCKGLFTFYKRPFLSRASPVTIAFFRSEKPVGDQAGCLEDTPALSHLAKAER